VLRLVKVTKSPHEKNNQERLIKVSYDVEFILMFPLADASEIKIANGAVFVFFFWHHQTGSWEGYDDDDVIDSVR
jgi:hypothetical protein